MAKISRLNSLPSVTNFQSGDEVILPDGREFVLSNNNVWTLKKSGNYLEHKGQLTTENLNIIIKNGIYFQASNGQATLALNYPVTSAGTLEVLNQNFTNSYAIYQRYTVLSGQLNENEIYNRGCFNGVWSTWLKGVNNTNLQTSLNEYWKVYSVGGFTGINTDESFAILNNGAAQNIIAGGLTISNIYSDSVYQPANGIYSKGTIKTESDGNSTQWNQAYQALVNNDIHKIDKQDLINNGSISHSNQTWFDYNWAGSGKQGSVINFSGLSGNYSSELFVQYNGDSIGVRSHNGNSDLWNSTKWLWHSGNLDPSTFLTPTSLNNYVPYTGANQNLNLNTQRITSVGTINHAGTPREATNIGRFNEIITINNETLFTNQSHYWNGTNFLTTAGVYHVGAFAGYNNNGNYIASFGHSANRYNTGNSVCSIGHYAGKHNTGGDTINLGTFSGNYNTGNSVFNGGTNAGYYCAASFIINIGLNTGMRTTSNNSVFLGYDCGMYTQGSNNVAIGNRSNAKFKDNVVGNKTFDSTAIDLVAKTITIPSHGFGNVGTYINLKFTQGTSSITGINTGDIIQIKVVDSNTIFFAELLSSGQYRQTVNITNAGTGTGHIFTPQFTYNNTVIIGNSLEPTKSNQNIISGGEFLMPQSTVSTIDADNTNKTLITKEWYTAKLAQGFSVGNLYDASQSLNTISGNQVFRSQGATGFISNLHGTGIQVTQSTSGNSYGWQLASDGTKMAFRVNSTDNYASSVWKTFWDSSNFNPSGYYTKTESSNLFVGKNGIENINNTKTFTSSPNVPTATLGTHAVNLNQLADYVKTSDTIKVTITGITQDVTHNFNTYDIVCEGYDTSTMYNLPLKYKRKNLNTVTIEFDTPTTNSVRLIITKK